MYVKNKSTLQGNKQIYVFLGANNLPLLNMSIEDIIATTKDFLSEEFEVDRELIQPGSDLKATLDLDSLDYVDLVVLIEENFNVKVTGEDFKSIVTFNDFYQFVASRLAPLAVDPTL